MELCTAQSTSNLLLLHPKYFPPKYAQSQSTICCRNQLNFIRKQLIFNSGLQYHRSSTLRCSVSEGASTDTSTTSSYGGGVTVEEDKSYFPNYTQPAEKTDDKDAQVKVEDKVGDEDNGGVKIEDKSYFPSSVEDTEQKTEEKDTEVKVEDKGDSEYDGSVKIEDTQTVEKTEDKNAQVGEDKADPEDNGAVKFEDSQTVEKTEDKDTQVNKHIKVEVEDTKPVEQTQDKDNQLNEALEEGLSLDVQPLFKLLEDFNIKVDDDDKYPIIVLGGGALVALWILASVVRAIDSIPLFPKVFELVGIGYSIWFSYRYLIFKEKRDELVARIEQIKQNVIG